MNSSYSKLIENLEYLKLNQMIAHLDETIDFMNNNNLSFIDALIKLTDYEVDMKEINMTKANSLNSVYNNSSFFKRKRMIK